MSEMIERVASAIDGASPGKSELRFSSYSGIREVTVQHIPTGIAVNAPSAAAGVRRLASLLCACAAIEAMREPTADMFDAGHKCAQELGADGALIGPWRAMIDQALSEK